MDRPQHSTQLSSDKRYSSEAVQYILQRAMTHQSTDGFTDTQLQEMAAELNIEPALLQQAAIEWQTQQLPPNTTGNAPSEQRRRDNNLIRFALYSVGGVVIFCALSFLGFLPYMLLAALGAGAYYFFINLQKFWRLMKRTVFTRRANS